MFIKTAIALALIASTASAALAETKRSVNPSWDVYNNRGARIGADPDPNVRFMLRHDQGKD
jgi:hypothetical protein